MALFGCNLNPHDVKEIKELLRDILHNQQEFHKQMANLKDELTSIDGNLGSLNDNFTAFKGDVDRLIADFQANNPNDPAVQALLASIQAKVGTLGTAIGAEDAGVNAADPAQSQAS